MPNHCSQDLFVSGPLEQLKEFIEFSQGEDQSGTLSVLNHNKYIPYPEKYAQMDREAEELNKNKKPGEPWKIDGYNSGGYEWCKQNWGTKWGIYNTSIVNKKYGKKVGKIRYFFESAWSPASKIILAMSQKFLELTFLLKYYELGAAYKGVYKVKGGIVLEDQHSEYHGSRGG